MEYKIVASTSISGLAKIVEESITGGWRPQGGHQVVEAHRQNRYSGTQHMSTEVRLEYSQALILEKKDKEKMKGGIINERV